MFKANDVVSFKIAPDTRMVVAEVLDETFAVFRKPEDDGVRVTWNMAGFDLVESAAE